MPVAVDVSVRYWIKDPISVLKEAKVENPETDTQKKLEALLSDLTLSGINTDELIDSCGIDVSVNPTTVKEEQEKMNE